MKTTRSTKVEKSAKVLLVIFIVTLHPSHCQSTFHIETLQLEWHRPCLLVGSDVFVEAALPSDAFQLMRSPSFANRWFGFCGEDPSALL